MGKLIILFLIVLPMMLTAQSNDPSDADPIDPDPLQLLNAESATFELSNKRIEINHGDLSIFVEAGLLTEAQMLAIHQHIRMHGKLLSLLELQSIELLSVADIRKILPYVFVRTDGVNQDWKMRQTLSFSSTIRSTVPDEVDQSSLLFRYRGNAGDRISWGVTAENDAKEKFRFEDSQYGFDHLSGFVELRRTGIFTKVIAGDFLAGFGQGLTVWNTFSRNPSADIITLKKLMPGLKPNTGRNEITFFRGLSAEAKITKKLSLILFGSRKALDATLARNEMSEEDEIQGFPSSGYHRTESELASRKSATVTTTAGTLQWRHQRTRAGMNLVSASFEHPVVTSTELHEIRNLSGRKNHVASVDYASSVLNMDLFGELAVSGNKGFGILQGALLSAGPNLGIGILYMYYSPGYQSFYQYAASTLGMGSNETGIYLNADLKINKSVSVQAYSRSTRSILPTRSSNLPQDRNDYRMTTTYAVGKRTFLKATGTYRGSLANFKGAGYMQETQRVSQKGLAVTFNQGVNEQINIWVNCTTREAGEASVFTSGFLFSCGGRMMLSKAISVAGGIAVYESQKGISLYIPEESISGSTSFATAYGSGEKVYVAFSGKLPYGLKTQFKLTIAKPVEKEIDHTLSFHVSKTIVKK